MHTTPQHAQHSGPPGPNEAYLLYAEAKQQRRRAILPEKRALRFSLLARAAHVTRPNTHMTIRNPCATFTTLMSMTMTHDKVEAKSGSLLQ